MPDKLSDYRSIILALATLPFVLNYRDQFQDWLYDRKGPDMAMNTSDVMTNSSPLVPPARIEHLDGNVYKVTFDSDGDGTLDEQTTGILYGRNPNSLDGKLD